MDVPRVSLATFAQSSLPRKRLRVDVDEPPRFAPIDCAHAANAIHFVRDLRRMRFYPDLSTASTPRDIFCPSVRGWGGSRSVQKMYGAPVLGYTMPEKARARRFEQNKDVVWRTSNMPAEGCGRPGMIGAQQEGFQRAPHRSVPPSSGMVQAPRL